MKTLEVLHASGQVEDEPVIRLTQFTKDFSWGFYCTTNFKQAHKWAIQKSPTPTINYYRYNENHQLNVLKFNDLDDEWLDFIANCRKGIHHKYDIVEGPMADDQLWNFVDDYLEGHLPKEAFKAICKFQYPTHQISFHTIDALMQLSFIRSEEIHDT